MNLFKIAFGATIYYNVCGFFYLPEAAMYKSILFFISLTALIFTSCSSKESALSDDEQFEWQDKDEHNLPVMDDESPNLPDNDLPDDLSDDSSDEPDAELETPDEESDNDSPVTDDSLPITDEDEQPDNSEEPDEDDSFYALTCDCYGIEYEIPAAYREVKDWCYKDSSGDGVPNCVEIDEGFFLVELPYDASEDEERILNFKTNVERADILILVDLSGSMAGEINNLKNGITDIIINEIGFTINDAGFGLATFDDWKGIGDDTIYQLVQPITTDMNVVADAVNGLNRLSWCGWEPHPQALYQAASGAGYNGHFTFNRRESSTNNCDVSGEYYPAIPPVDCSMAEGNIGGACFRRDSLPIIIMLSDEWFHDYPGKYPDMFEWHTPYNTKQQAIHALNAINAKFIGIDSWHSGMNWTGSPENDFKEISIATGSVDGITGEPFFYSIDPDGSGLSDDIVDAVLQLSSNVKRDVWTEKESIENSYGIDSSLFIKSLTPVSTVPPNSYLSKDSAKFVQVHPGATVNFELLFHNSIYEPVGPETAVFRAKINVLGDGALLDTRNVVIIVPGSK